MSLLESCLKEEFVDITAQWLSHKHAVPVYEIWSHLVDTEVEPSEIIEWFEALKQRGVIKPTANVQFFTVPKRGSFVFEMHLLNHGEKVMVKPVDEFLGVNRNWDPSNLEAFFDELTSLSDDQQEQESSEPEIDPLEVDADLISPHVEPLFDLPLEGEVVSQEQEGIGVTDQVAEQIQEEEEEPMEMTEEYALITPEQENRKLEIVQSLLQKVEVASEEAMSLQLAKQTIVPKKYIRLFMDLEEELNELKQSLQTPAQEE
ncbi:hypothetical protein [Ammoniphilus resinae]|uniref:Uncharacterized protein n=1 Tax=Ammoniphilus resinae TaxID=861532 RepID=A0ABS4GWL4_9BACL|nr:hypothetical protein [Ammoniphilus resinae]MBP1934673.1 hypothetical protein [Ammoniphilus resinae]